MIMLLVTHDTSQHSTAQHCTVSCYFSSIPGMRLTAQSLREVGGPLEESGDEQLVDPEEAFWAAWTSIEAAA